jgi:hypothetical protein
MSWLDAVEFPRRNNYILSFFWGRSMFIIENLHNYYYYYGII